MSFLKIFIALFVVSFSSFANVIYYPHSNPNAPYSVATQIGNVVYLSGVVATDENGKLADNITAQAHQTLKNVEKAAQTAGVELSDIFKCTVMIEDIKQWPDFNKVYVQYFEKGKLPARSAFGADGLAFGSMLELECWAYKSR